MSLYPVSFSIVRVNGFTSTYVDNNRGCSLQSSKVPNYVSKYPTENLFLKKKTPHKH